MNGRGRGPGKIGHQLATAAELDIDNRDGYDDEMLSCSLYMFESFKVDFKHFQDRPKAQTLNLKSSKFGK